MSELIDREALLDELWKQRRNYQLMDDTQTADKIMHGLYRAEQAVKDAPSIPAPRWVRCEEPPKDSKPVICWEKQGFPYVDRYFPKYGWEFANNALAEPIYWMPIEPPKEGE